MTPSPPSFGDVVDAHQREILRYLRRLTGGASEAEDLFQETFLRALEAFDRLREGSHHRAWVYRIATNVFLNHRRGKRRRAEVPLVEASTAGHAASPADGLTLEGCRAAIATLPRRQRAAFVQRRVLGWGYREIAEAMGGTEAGARANVYQAARRLRQVLGRPRPEKGATHGGPRADLRTDDDPARIGAGR